MGKQSGAVRRPAAQDDARPDALAYWYLQETTPLDAGDAIDLPPVEAADDAPMASGWWLLPALVLSLPAWVLLVMALF